MVNKKNNDFTIGIPDAFLAEVGKTGNSLCVVIPSKAVKYLGLKKGVN